MGLYDGGVQFQWGLSISYLLPFLSNRVCGVPIREKVILQITSFLPRFRPEGLSTCLSGYQDYRLMRHKVRKSMGRLLEGLRRNRRINISSLDARVTVGASSSTL